MQSAVTCSNGPLRGRCYWVAMNLSALLAGAVTVLGFAPFGWFGIPLLSLSALFALINRCDTSAQAAWLGYLWGLGCFAVGVSWIYNGMHDTGGMPAPYAAIATLAFCSLLSALPAASSGLIVRLRHRSALQRALCAAAVWTIGEWLRGWILSGFPWLAIGYSQGPGSPLSGFAPLLGVYGITFISAAMAAGVAFATTRREAAAVIVFSIAIWGLGASLRYVDWVQPMGMPVTVSLLQGNVPQEHKWDPNARQASLDVYARLSEAHPAQITVLPETALPMFLREVPADYLRNLSTNGPALMGIADLDGELGKSETYYNVAVVIANGLRNESYRKVHLVPFGESTPWLFAWFEGLMHVPLRDFSRGAPSQPLLDLAGQKVLPSICYEDMYGADIARSAAGSSLLINLSNLAWFGRSVALPQHLQITQMRAMESGRPALVAANTGITAAIDAHGRVMAALPAFEAGALTVHVQGTAGRTPYVRWGNVPVLILAALVLLATLRPHRA